MAVTDALWLVTGYLHVAAEKRGRFRIDFYWIWSLGDFEPGPVFGAT